MSSDKDILFPSRILGVQFSLMSPEEVRRFATVEVQSKETYNNNREVPGGLFDPRMGVLGPGIVCPTDGQTYKSTPGYFGYIELARPVFWLQHKDIKKVLQCVCFQCSRLLISKTQHAHVWKMSATDRWKYVNKQCSRVKRCGEAISDGCGCKQPKKIRADTLAFMTAIWEGLAPSSLVHDLPIGSQGAAAAAAAPSSTPPPLLPPTFAISSTSSVSDTFVQGLSVAGALDKNNTTMVRLPPEVVLKIFKRISDEDVAFMGFHPTWSRPEWMICEVLPVAPPAVRPSVKHDANQRSEDDLTHIYVHIIKTNNELRVKMREPNTSSTTIDHLTTILQYYVAMICNNKIKGAHPMQQRSGRTLQCIAGRINGKYGRIRGNLMGKRVDYSARSVITGDPNLSVQEWGIPVEIAMKLTVPVVVNARNREFLTALVRNGPDKYPGAKMVIRPNGDNILLRNRNLELIELEDGCEVHRHLMNGDPLLCNRQPSLHKMSMMCHIARIMPRGSPFRFRVEDTAPYNADYDGDEMNIHVPQNALSETELRTLAAIPYQIVSPSSNAPVIGVKQDVCLGGFLFTRPHVQFTTREVMNLLMMYPQLRPERLFGAGHGGLRQMEKERDREISSFDILSQILPPLTLKFNTKLYDEDRNTPEVNANHVLEILQGRYVRGQAEKSVFSSGTKGILHRIFNDFGPMACADFMDDYGQVIMEYMKTCAYSVGVSDLMSNRATTAKIQSIVKKKKEEVEEIIQKVHLGLFDNNTGRSNVVAFENQVKNVLNEATNTMAETSINNLDPNNRFCKIVNSGSKGNMVNVSQMISCLGQTTIDGARVPYCYDNRTLPHFTKFDDSPASRGFIENCYISGLAAHEMFFHAMGGRIGLIDTAVKTSSTGYIQRRIVKGLEDLKVEYDMTVRNHMGKIVQFAYGDDGINSTKVENQSVELVKMGIGSLYAHFDLRIKPLDAGKGAPDYSPIFQKAALTRARQQEAEAMKRCQALVDRMMAARDVLVTRVFAYKNESSVKAPVAFVHLMNSVQAQLHLTERMSVDITPLECMDLIEAALARLRRSRYCPPTSLFELLFQFYVHPRELLFKRHFHRQAVEILLEKVCAQYRKSLVHPGEMVGVIAGQSIGEPTTQMTLNTFHHVGNASKTNVTRGVPRIEEILRLTKNPKNPSATIYLKDTDQFDKEKATSLCHMIQHARLRDVVQASEILFDPHEDRSNIVADRPFLEKFFEFEQIVENALRGRVTTLSSSSLSATSDSLVHEDVDPSLTEDPDAMQTIREEDLFLMAAAATTTTITNTTNTAPLPPESVVQNTATGATAMTASDVVSVEHILPSVGGNSVASASASSLLSSSSSALFVQGEKGVRGKQQGGGRRRMTGTTANMSSSNKSKWILRIVLDPEIMLEKNITMDDVHFAIRNVFANDIACTFSDLNSNELVLRVRANSSLFAKTKKKFTVRNLVPTLQSPSASMAVAGESDNFAAVAAGGGEGMPPPPVWFTSTVPAPDGDEEYTIDQMDQIYVMKLFQGQLLNSIVLRGVAGISNVVPRVVKSSVWKNEGKYERKESWVLDTIGTNLEDLLALDYIDYRRTFSNDIREIYDLLGIEAARQCILNELIEVIEFSDAYVNYHHLSILCDRMTIATNLISIFRSGFLRDNIGPLAKSTFEEHTEVFLEAARHGDCDNVRGVSANVMLGQPGLYGTNAFSVMLDQETLRDFAATTSNTSSSFFPRGSVAAASTSISPSPSHSLYRQRREQREMMSHVHRQSTEDPERTYDPNIILERTHIGQIVAKSAARNQTPTSSAGGLTAAVAATATASMDELMDDDYEF